jgi:hypothetical protein
VLVGGLLRRRLGSSLKPMIDHDLQTPALRNRCREESTTTENLSPSGDGPGKDLAKACPSIGEAAAQYGK